MVRFSEYLKYVSAKSNNQENGVVTSLSVEDFKDKPKQKNTPRFVLSLRGERSLLSAKSSLQVPLTFDSVQCLILQALLGTKAPETLWCNLHKRKFVSNVTVVIVDGWNMSDLTSITSEEEEPPAKKKRVSEEGSSNLRRDSDLIQPAEEDENLLERVNGILPYTSVCFPLKFKVTPPLNEPDADLFSSIPMSVEIVRSLKEKYRSFKRAAKSNVVFPIACEEEEEEEKEEPRLKEKFEPLVEDHVDQFSRVDLLLSLREMAKYNFPVGIEGTLSGRDWRFVPLHSHYKKVTENSPMYGIDCEMCHTTAGIELTRVSVVDEKLKVIYSSFVKPSNTIVNYLTMYSGVTPDHLRNVTTSVVEVQQQLRNILPRDCILVGHSIDHDLCALKLLHPYIIDTSLIYNLSGDVYRKASLKMLVKLFLKQDIQTGSVKGHDPAEDAAAALELALLKLRNSTSFGDINKSGENVLSKAGILRSMRESRSDKLSSFYSAKNAFGESYGSSVPKIIKLEVDNKSICFSNSEETLVRFKSYGMDRGQLTSQFSESLEAQPEENTSYKLIVRHCQVPDILNSSHIRLREKLELLDEKLKKLHETMPENSLIMILFSKKMDFEKQNDLLLLDFKGQEQTFLKS